MPCCCGYSFQGSVFNNTQKKIADAEIPQNYYYKLLQEEATQVAKKHIKIIQTSLT